MSRGIYARKRTRATRPQVEARKLVDADMEMLVELSAKWHARLTVKQDGRVTLRVAPVAGGLPEVLK